MDSENNDKIICNECLDSYYFDYDRNDSKSVPKCIKTDLEGCMVISRYV